MYGKVKHIIFFILVCPAFVFSQINSIDDNFSKNYFGISFNTGITSFFGDIDEGPAKKGGVFKNNYAFGVSGYKNFGSLFILGGQILAGKLSGEKKRGDNGNVFNQYFKANFIEYSLKTEYNLIAFFSNRVNRKFCLYANVGIGLIDFKTRLYDGFTDSIVGSFGYEGQKSTTELVIPIGIRVVYNINKRSAISLQTSSRRVDTDKLDAMTGNNNRDYFNYTSIEYIFKIYPKRKESNILEPSATKSKSRHKKPRPYKLKKIKRKDEKEKKKKSKSYPEK
ncbi:MAG: hypothetical protein H8D45_21785 [Bacteroidetes bacterium]|nr:hypothetical protein [Bacteroidota bacterium]MBL7103348.1 hypothetical protein [Bacteroidales bacterium]